MTLHRLLRVSLLRARPPQAKVSLEQKLKAAEREREAALAAAEAAAAAAPVTAAVDPAELDEARASHAAAVAAHADANATLEALRREHDALHAKHGELSTEHGKMSEMHDRMQVGGKAGWGLRAGLAGGGCASSCSIVARAMARRDLSLTPASFCVLATTFASRNQVELVTAKMTLATNGIECRFE
jgi:hypothetical protein